jgi:hypothetical protein
MPLADPTHTAAMAHHVPAHTGDEQRQRGRGARPPVVRGSSWRLGCRRARRTQALVFPAIGLAAGGTIDLPQDLRGVVEVER